MALSKEARDFFVKQGRKGGKKSAAKLAKMAPKDVSEMKRRAAQARWAKVKKEKERATADTKIAREPVTLKVRERKAAQSTKSSK